MKAVFIFLPRCRSSLAIIFLLPLIASAIFAADSPTPWNCSVKVLEDSSSYTIQANVPDSDAVNARLEGRSLRLDTTTPSGLRHDQRFFLPKAKPDSVPQINRSKGQIVVTVFKGDPAFNTPSLPISSDPFANDFDAKFDAMRDQMLSQAASMLGQLNKNTQGSDTQGRSAQDLIGSIIGSVASQLSGGPAKGFELRELPDRFVLSAELAEDEARNISVNVDNGRFVTITARQEKKSGGAGISAFSSGSSTQSMTLPSPVNVEQLKMDYKNGRLEVVLPKS